MKKCNKIPEGIVVKSLGFDALGCPVIQDITANPTETPIMVIETSSILLIAGASGAGHTGLKGEVKVSAEPGNIVQVREDGIFTEVDVSSKPNNLITNEPDGLFVEVKVSGATGNNLTINPDGLYSTTKVSTTAGNSIVVNPDGIFVPPVIPFVETPLTVTSSPTILMTAGSGNGHTGVTSSLKIAGDAGNLIEIRPTGIYVGAVTPPPTVLQQFIDDSTDKEISSFAVKDYVTYKGQEVRVSDFADLNSALVSVGSSIAKVIIDEDVVLSTNTTIPSNVILNRVGDSKITVTTGNVLTVAAELDPDTSKRVLFDGEIEFDPVSLTSVFRPEWFAPRKVTIPAPQTSPILAGFSTLGVFGATTLNGFIAGNTYRVGVAYVGRTGLTAMSPTVTFVAKQGQAIGVRPDDSITSKGIAAEVYIQDVTASGTFRRAKEVSGAVPSNLVMFGDDNPFGGLVVTYNPAGAIFVSSANATTADNIGTVAAPTKPPIIKTIGAIPAGIQATVAYSYTAADGTETALSPDSATVLVSSNLDGRYLSAFVREVPPVGAIGINYYLKIDSGAYIKQKTNEPLHYVRSDFHEVVSGGANVPGAAQSPLSGVHLAYQAMLSHRSGELKLSNLYTMEAPFIVSNFYKGVYVWGLKITSEGTNDWPYGFRGESRIQFKGNFRNGLVLCSSTVHIEHVDFEDPNRIIEFGVGVCDPLGGMGHQNSVFRCSFHAKYLDRGIGIDSNVLSSNSGSHASDTSEFTDCGVVYSGWGIVLGGAQTLQMEFGKISADGNLCTSANSGLVKTFGSPASFRSLTVSATGHYKYFVTNAYLDKFVGNKGRILSKFSYSESSNIEVMFAASPLDINGSVGQFEVLYADSQNTANVYGFLLLNNAYINIEDKVTAPAPGVNFSLDLTAKLTNNGKEPVFLLRRSPAIPEVPGIDLSNVRLNFYDYLGNRSTLGLNAAGELELDPHLKVVTDVLGITSKLQIPVAVGTILGVVVGKVEVFNAAGVSMGFVPVYSTIT